jgi:hypothetical protein
MKTVFVVAALAISALCPQMSTAQEIPQGPRPEIVRASCDPQGCDEIAVASDVTLVSRPGLALKKTRLHTYRIEGGVRTAKQDEVGAVACSPDHPAVVAERDGRRMAVYLAPNAEAADRSLTNVVATYFAVCHGPTLARAAVADLPGTAARLGYDVPAVAARIVPVQRFEDVIASGPSRFPERRDLSTMARPDVAPLPPRPIPDQDFED